MRHVLVGPTLCCFVCVLILLVLSLCSTCHHPSFGLANQMSVSEFACRFIFRSLCHVVLSVHFPRCPRVCLLLSCSDNRVLVSEFLRYPFVLTCLPQSQSKSFNCAEFCMSTCLSYESTRVGCRSLVTCLLLSCLFRGFLCHPLLCLPYCQVSHVRSLSCVVNRVLETSCVRVNLTTGTTNSFRLTLTRFNDHALLIE